MRQSILVTILTCLAIGQTTAVKANEIGELRELIRKQAEQLQQLQKRLDELEAKQKHQTQEVQKKVEQEVTDAVKDKQVSALPDSLKWVEKVKVSGDLRYRQDHIDKQDSTGSWENGVYRHRIRARLKVDAKVNDTFDLGVRVASGNDRSPITTNQDLEDAFSKKELWLDQAYFNWHPASVEGLNVTGGKINNPFYKAGKNQLIWDSDLNPEGIAARYSTPLNDTDQLFFNGGGLWVDESSSVADISLWAAQTYWKRTIGNPDHVLAGATYYDYGNIESSADLRSTWGTSNFYGNTTDGAGGYRDDFNIVELFGEYGFKCGSLPTALFASWVRNIVATTSEDTGWLIGTRFNKAKDDDPGSWECGYDYRETDADAVVGGFQESDHLGAQTNSKGHRFVFRYQLARNLYWYATYYLLEDTRTSSDLDYRRLMGDLVWKF
jgi:predicted house-cleaning noncanonical NTP pyrophosphatase (MazG superfamily)